MKSFKPIIIAAAFLLSAAAYLFFSRDSGELIINAEESPYEDAGEGTETDPPPEEASVLYREAELDELKQELRLLREAIEILRSEGIKLSLKDTGLEGSELLLKPQEAQAEDSGLININTADKASLMELPGIGEAKAESIIAYRENYGDFESIEEIMNISGIKEAAFEKLKELITV